APLLGSTRGSDYESRPDGADLRAQGRPAEAMLSEIDARDAGERTAVSPREGIKWGGTRNGRKHSSCIAEAKRDRDESPAQFPDSEGHCLPPRASAGGLSPSPFTALHRPATREPPDKTNSNGSSLCSGQSSSRLRSATVPSAAPSFWSSYLSTPESGPDSANWRARGWPKASPRHEVGAVKADLQDKSISKRKKDSPHGSPHRSYWEASSQASAQDRPQVYAGGQVLAPSQRDGKPENSRDVGKCLPQSAEGDTMVTVPDDPGHSQGSDGQHPDPRASAVCLLPSSTAEPRKHAARVPPNKRTSNGCSPRNYQPTSYPRSATVPSAAPLHGSSHQSMTGNGPDSANWRTQRRPSVSSLREAGTPDPSQRTAISSRHSLSSYSAWTRRLYSPRLDVADAAAPSAFRLPVLAFERGPILERPKRGASESKRVHAGGQTVLSSCKDVKLLDTREGKKDPPQFIASDFEGRYLLFSKLDPATPSIYSSGVFALCCNGSGIGHGRKGISRSPVSPALSAREAGMIQQSCELGSGTEDQVSLINGKGNNSPVDAARDCGHGTHAYDSEDADMFALLSVRGPPDKSSASSAKNPLHSIASSFQRDIRDCPNLPRRDSDAQDLASIVQRFGSRNTAQQMRVLSCEDAASLAQRIGHLGARGAIPSDQRRPVASTAMSEVISVSAKIRTTGGSAGSSQAAHMHPSRGPWALRIESRPLDSGEIKLWKRQSASGQTHQIFPWGAMHFRHQRWEMRVIIREKTGAWGPIVCHARDAGGASLHKSRRGESSYRRWIGRTLLKYSDLCKLLRISNSSRATRDSSPHEI
ncbi:hypothetical protein EV121DRAFT_175136, partial [Schizophyllum commune]